ncbi:MAG: hypothetical protein AB8B64_17085 [Granulosicoccus sp.]
MIARPFARSLKCRLLSSVGLSAGLLFLFGAALAQESMSLEDLERLVTEQRIALEEAIANRESTAAQAAEVQKELDAAEARSREVEEELHALCEEQELLKEGTYDSCIKSEGS